MVRFLDIVCGIHFSGSEEQVGPKSKVFQCVVSFPFQDDSDSNKTLPTTFLPQHRTGA